MKINTFLCVVVLFLFLQESFAQSFAWAKKMGGTGNSNGQSITVDGAGSIYTTGTFQTTVDFNPGIGTFNLTSAGSNDIFISKLDSVGNFVWAKRIGNSTNNDNGKSITVDSAGNVYVTGTFQGTVDFDPGVGTFNLTSIGNNDIFISKLSNNGNFIWAKQIGGTQNESGNSIIVDPSGFLYVTGFFSGTVDFDPNVATFNLTASGVSTAYDVFISKLDANGNFVWAKKIGGTGNDIGNALVLDASGNVYTTGSFTSTVDFDPGPGIFNITWVSGFDIFILKLDSNGNFVWAKQFGGLSNNETGLSINLDANDNIYTAGIFNGTVDFDPGPAIYNLAPIGNNYDFYISKLDSNGNFVWAKQFGGVSDDYIRSIKVDSQGNIFSTGDFAGTADFDPNGGTFNLTSSGNKDIFILKVDSSGNLIWVKKIGGASLDSGQAIEIDNYDNIYTTGQFSNTVDFDPGINVFDLVSNSLDIFVHKMRTCLPLTGTDIQTACSSYTWIDGITYTSSNNSATFNILGGSSNGCDSIVTLNLTIRQPSSSTLTQSACSSYTLNGQTYTSSGTFTQILTNAAGCDSTITLNLNISTPPTDAVSISGNTLTAIATGASYQWLDCNNNLSPVSGATAQSYQPTASGSYAVQITNGPCQDTSQCTNLTIVALNQQNASQIKIYPNPANDYFTIEAEPTFIGLNYKVIDVLGRELKSGKINNLVSIISIEDLSPGIYTIIGQNESFLYKLVKE